jgi:hypothetical protein
MSQLLGYLWDLDIEKKPDWSAGAKSLMACMAFAENAERPEEIDPRKWHRQEWQKRNDCAGHGSTSTGEAAFTHQTGLVIQFSPHYSYRKAQIIDGIRGDNGATISGCVESAMKDGLCPLQYCPYPANYSSPITQEMDERAADYKIGSYGEVHQYDEVIACLISGLGIHWGLGYDFSGPGGNVLDRFSGRGPGHATALLGYSTRKDKRGRNYVWLANSGYPTPGFYEVAPDAVQKALDQPRTVALSMSRLSYPMPAPVRYAPLGD